MCPSPVRNPRPSTAAVSILSTAHQWVFILCCGDCSWWCCCGSGGGGSVACFSFFFSSYLHTRTLLLCMHLHLLSSEVTGLPKTLISSTSTRNKTTIGVTNSSLYVRTYRYNKYTLSVLFSYNPYICMQVCYTPCVSGTRARNTILARKNFYLHTGCVRVCFFSLFFASFPLLSFLPLPTRNISIL